MTKPEAPPIARHAPPRARMPDLDRQPGVRPWRAGPRA
ncbi:hypothetical protein OPEN69S_00869 [Ottowia pentelensis]